VGKERTRSGAGRSLKALDRHRFFVDDRRRVHRTDHGCDGGLVHLVREIRSEYHRAGSLEDAAGPAAGGAIGEAVVVAA
jgi:hypothetical protein